MPPEQDTPAAPPQPIKGLTMGRTVYYVLDKPYSAGEAHAVRPAVVVQVWDAHTGCVDLQVLADGTNDGPDFAASPVWKTSRVYSEGREPGTWHWPPKV